MTAGTINGLMTLGMLVAFLAIVYWAWSKRRKAEFEEMAELPFHEAPPGKEQGSKTP